MNYSLLRQKARDDLANSPFSSKWLLAVAFSLIYTVIASFANGTVIGVPLVTGPFFVGYCAAFLNASRNKQMVTFPDLFSGFTQNYGRSLLLYLLTTLYTLLWSMLFVIPGIIKGYAYSMAPFIAMDHPELSANECITRSREMMDGHKWELFVLNLTFFGWWCLTVLSCGIIAPWVSAYAFAAKVNFYRTLNSEQI